MTRTVWCRFSHSRNPDIVRNGELEATNYFCTLGDDDIARLEDPSVPHVISGH